MSLPQREFRLSNGTVIDHLPVGAAGRALSLLGLPREGPVSVGLNIPSARHGAKDIVRVEGIALGAEELARLALLGPQITVSIVQDGAVSEKQILDVPLRLEGILTCPNPTCITNAEPVTTVFHRIGDFPFRFRCHYCERSTTPRD